MILLTLAPRKVQSVVRSQVALRLCANMMELALGVYWIFVVGIILILGHSFTDANWLVWQTALTIGYGTNLPEAPVGKWFTMLMGTLAVLSSTAVFGAIINLITEQQARLKGGYVNNPHKNGYVVFGYPGEGNLIELIRQMRITQPHVPVCVVDNALDELPIAVRELPDVHFVRGGHLKRDVYEKAQLATQLGVAVFPTDRNDPNSDAVTANAVRLILGYLTERSATTRVLHLLVDPDNEHLLIDLRSQGITKRSDMLLVAQEWQGPGTAAVLEDLMRNDQGEDPQTVTPVLTIGMTWGALSEHALRLHKAGSDALFTPIALLREGGRNFRPSYDTVLRANDQVCVIASNSFNWRNTERAITEDDGGMHDAATRYAVA